MRKTIIFSILSLFSFPFANAKDICNYVENSNYWCGIGSTPDQAREELSKNILSYISTSLEKTAKNKNHKYNFSVSIKTKIESLSFLNNVKLSLCNGTYVACVRKDIYKKSLKNLFNSLLDRASTFNSENPKEIEDQIQLLQKLSNILTSLGESIDNKKFSKAIKVLKQKEENILKKKLYKNVNTYVDKLKLELSLVKEGKKSYSDFLNEKKKILRELSKLKDKYAWCPNCVAFISRAEEAILALGSNIKGKLKVVITEGEGEIFINGERRDEIETQKDTNLIVSIKGYDDYENRVYNLKLSKGEEKVLNIKLWKINKVFQTSSISFSFSTLKNSILISYRRTKDFNISILKPYLEFSLGYSVSKSGLIISTGGGINIFRKNLKEFLCLIKQNPLGINLGLNLGYYGFTDKDNGSFYFLSPYIGFSYLVTYNFSVNSKLKYIYAFKEDKITTPSLALDVGLSLYFDK